MLKRKVDFDVGKFQTFGDLLRSLRERARLSQRDLAQRVGYHYSYLSRLEKNVRAPDEMILRTRFIPALRIEHEPALVDRLIELANSAPASPAEKDQAADPPQRLRWEASLPASLTPLLGRESECESLFQILSSEEVRLVTLIGPPGVGKTRLSLHIAEQLSETFADGAIFVDLMPVLEAGQVIPALAATLGTLEASEVQVFEGVKAALRDRNMLIVMDNFEQVLDAAPSVSALLGAAPRVKILATSREALRLRGEQEFPLGPLPIPDEKTASALDFPSVQLFAQRARAAKPDLHLDEADVARVAEICRRLDGLPLAIELAAARIRLLSPANMLEQFDRRFQWLALTGRDIPEWRRTLWSAIYWSYNLLNEKGRILFERLSVFAGGWSIEAAEAVCADERMPRGEIINTLMQLADKSLVAAEAESRYRFLDTIQKFAHEKLIERGALDETSNRHLRYFADWAEALDAQFHTSSKLAFRKRTGADLNNIRNALEWALHHRDVFEDGARLSIPASLIFFEHGMVRDEYERAQMFLRGITDSVLQARLLVRTASLALQIDHNSLAYEYCRKAEALARQAGDERVVADALRIMGDMDYRVGKYDLAEPAYRECEQIYRKLNLLPQLSQGLACLSSLFFYNGNRDESGARMAEAMEIAERIEDATGMAYALRARAGQLTFLGNNAESFATFKRALDLARANGDRSSEGVCLNCLSIQSNLLEDYPTSEKYAREALALYQSIGYVAQAYTIRMLAYALLHQGAPSRAHALALKSLEDNLDGGTGVLNCLTALAEIRLAREDIKPVAQLYGYLAPRVREKYSPEVIPDSRSFERIERALEGQNTEHWQAEGASMNLEQAVAIASQWTPTGLSRPQRRPPKKRIPKSKQSRH